MVSLTWVPLRIRKVGMLLESCVSLGTQDTGGQDD
jgi:hypothetical protein